MNVVNELVRKTLINRVNVLLSPYPQYKNYFDDWQLATTRKTLKFKSGDIEAGTLFLAKLETAAFGSIRATIVDCENGFCKSVMDELPALVFLS